MAKTDPPRDRVRTLAMKLPDVEQGSTHGYPAFKVNDKAFAWFPKKKEVEDDTLAVRMSIPDRTARIEKNPDAFYVTPHYLDYPAMLVRVWELTDAQLKEVLRAGYDFILAEPAKKKSSRGARR